MEITRRNFIAGIVGSVAGLHITPLPWKLTDDIAIWTQNWPWVPVPPVGEFSEKKSVCTLCPGGCGIEVRMVDERAIKIEGRTDYPVNPGGLCPVGVGGLQLLYNESIRFTGPMKRVGPRGSGEFANITWNEALDTVAARITELRDAGRPEALAAVDGNPSGSTMSLLVERFLTAVGSPNYVRTPSVDDTHQMVNTLMQGTDGPEAYDLENADYVLSFGAGLLEGWGAPGRILNAWGYWRGDAKGKVKIVQVESRASNTASKADRWVPVKPGTEAALAMGLAHVIIKEGLYDRRFVNDHAFGFHDWRAGNGIRRKGFKSIALENYAPDRVAEMVGPDVVKADDIISLAREFARAKAPIAVCGKGKGALSGSLYEFMAVKSLNALVGNINQPGGIGVLDPLPLAQLDDLQPDAIAAKGNRAPRLDGAGSAAYPFTRSLLSGFTDAVLDAPKSPVDTLLVFSANPVYTMPDAGRFKKALKKIPFVVSFSPFRDETAYMADLILPDHTYLEKMDDVVWPSGLQYPLYGLTAPVVSPVYKTRNAGDTVLNLARKTGKEVAAGFPWKKYEALLKARAEGLFEAGGLVKYKGDKPVWETMASGSSGASGLKSFKDMWKKIKKDGLWYMAENPRSGSWDVFKTPTGKFEFASTKIESAFRKAGNGAEDTAFVGHYPEPEPEDGHADYPLQLVPYEIINLASGWTPNPPHLKKTLFDHQLLKDDSFIDINPETADKLGLKQRDFVNVRSHSGSVRVRVNLFEGAMPGVVYMPLGFGHTAYDEFCRDKGVNPNSIVRAGRDPLSGQPAWWATPVKLEKV
ncbi:MAG: molybdopterin-dependent oxidoreductase [Deltaproteobacteria bacterium]|nr:molybdopterin-dependent oxidoreductase [Deltaproteobacteria bacterium]MBW2283760.1 molybdopterin-dependent oxidoreductase [Deltaproteobacteria bacterium]